MRLLPSVLASTQILKISALPGECKQKHLRSVSAARSFRFEMMRNQFGLSMTIKFFPPPVEDTDFCLAKLCYHVYIVDDGY